MQKQIPKIIVEIQGGLVTAVATNLKQADLDLYVVDWDNIEAGDDVPDAPCLIDSPESDIEELLRQWQAEDRIKKAKEEREA